MSFHFASWPGFTATLALALLFAFTGQSSHPGVRRAAAAIGLAALFPLLLLGLLWPSMFTIAALLALPASAILLVAVVHPSLLQSAGVRAYSIVSVLLSPVSLLLLL